MTIVPYKGGRWQADVGFINGRRYRKVFTLKKEAEAWLDVHRKHRLYTSLGIPKLSPIQLADAEAAFGILGDLGTLREAALQYQKLARLETLRCSARRSRRSSII